MMASSKLQVDKPFSNFTSHSAPSLPLDPVQEAAADEEVLPLRPRKLHNSRLQRLSQLFPNFSYTKDTDSKPPEDLPNPPPLYQSALPRKAPPNRYRQPSPAAPIREAPLPPPKDLAFTNAPSESSHKLHKDPGSPRTLPVARNPSPVTGSTLQKVRPRGNSLAPPPTLTEVGHGRVVSSPVGSTPVSYHSEGETGRNSDAKLKRKSWLAGGKAKLRHASADLGRPHEPEAWVNAGQHRIEYNLSQLTNVEKVPELWDGNGDTFVYLFPRSVGRPPSFKVPSRILASSEPLLNLLDGGLYSAQARRPSFDGRNSLSAEDATRTLPVRGRVPPLQQLARESPRDNQFSADGSADSHASPSDTHQPREHYLYFPTALSSMGAGFSPQDVQSLVEVRNLFAFLTRQPLVSIRTLASPFRTMLGVAKLLRQFEFTSVDGSSLGEAATASFAFYLNEYKFADVTRSRERTLEALILGEAMKSDELYNEAFAHAVGKYTAIQELESPLYEEISPNTRNRLERAYLDLQQRERSVDLRLTNFDFPSLFAGIAASTTSDESKIVRFKAWRSNWMSLRKQILGYYKDLHGQWPPRASSKKNNFVEGGLNRLVLKCLYADLCSLYDLLADRSSLTTRSYEGFFDDGATATTDPTARALRKLLAEYDTSSPPVQPPIPFDVPRVPTIATVEPSYPFTSPREQYALSNRKLKDYEMILILAKSHNLDSDFKTPFLETFKRFEEKEARGKNCAELADMRYGHWIFLYAVIQSLPMLVVDAPGLKYTQDVEYFLCEPPMGHPPWMEDSGQVKMAWYGIQGGQGVVSLPSDIVNHGVEGIYRRSHCWLVAEKWISGGEADLPVSQNADPLSGTALLSPLAPPPGFSGAAFGQVPLGHNRQRSSSIGVGSHNDQRSDTLSPDGYSDSERRSRSRHSQRRSLALGLEELSFSNGTDPWSPALRASERGSSPVVGGYGSRNASRNASRNTSRERRSGGDSVGAGTGRSASASVATGSGRGSTFDDILGGMDEEQGGKRGRKKK